jgi:hypothetical protein
MRRIWRYSSSKRFKKGLRGGSTRVEATGRRDMGSGVNSSAPNFSFQLGPASYPAGRPSHSNAKPGQPDLIDRAVGHNETSASIEAVEWRSDVDTTN